MQGSNGVATAMGGREWAMLLLLAVVWGGSFFFNGVAVRELPSLQVWMRVAVAAATLLLLLGAVGHRMPKQGPVWAAFFGMGLLNNAVPFALIVWGQHHIASGPASTLNATTPLFTVLIAHLLTPDERLTPLRAAGRRGRLRGSRGHGRAGCAGGLGTGLLAQLACLASALSYAFAGIFGRRFKRMGAAPMATAAGQVSASTLLLPVMLLVDRPCAGEASGQGYWSIWAASNGRRACTGRGIAGRAAPVRCAFHAVGSGHRRCRM